MHQNLHPYTDEHQKTGEKISGSGSKLKAEKDKSMKPMLLLRKNKEAMMSPMMTKAQSVNMDEKGSSSKDKEGKKFYYEL